MKPHRFDPVSFLFGALFVGVAGWVGLADAPLWHLEGRWLWPAVLIGLGLLMFASVLSSAGNGRNSRRDDDAFLRDDL